MIPDEAGGFHVANQAVLGRFCGFAVDRAQIWALAAAHPGREANLCIYVGHSAGLAASLQLSASCWGL